jgi:hypothetical protein
MLLLQNLFDGEFKINLVPCVQGSFSAASNVIFTETFIHAFVKKILNVFKLHKILPLNFIDNKICKNGVNILFLSMDALAPETLLQNVISGIFSSSSHREFLN